jgi:hypothetical protein
MLRSSVRIGPLNQDFIRGKNKVPVRKMDGKARELSMLGQNIAASLGIRGRCHQWAVCRAGRARHSTASAEWTMTWDSP